MCRAQNELLCQYVAMAFTETVADLMQQFDGEQLQELIKKLVVLDSEWIPKEKGYSLYIRRSYLWVKLSSKLIAQDRR
jgi:hypothetical protein